MLSSSLASGGGGCNPSDGPSPTGHIIARIVDDKQTTSSASSTSSLDISSKSSSRSQSFSKSSSSTSWTSSGSSKFKPPKQNLRKNQQKKIKPIAKANDESTECSLKKQIRQGLIKDQSYIVLDTVALKSPTDKTAHIFLVKLCNPWQRLNQKTMPNKCKCSKKTKNRSKDNNSTHTRIFDGKWIGSWSENSEEWINLNDDVKAQFNMNINNNEFWMSLEDFVEMFTDVDIWHRAQPTQWQTLDSSLATKNWQRCNMIVFDGYWLSGVSAGGCSDKETFCQNPAYLIPIKKFDSTQNDGKPTSLTVLIALLQKYRSAKRTTGFPDLRIGFQVFKLQLSEMMEYAKEIIYVSQMMHLQQAQDSSVSSPTATETASTEDTTEDFTTQLMVRMHPEFFRKVADATVIDLYFSNVREMTVRYEVCTSGSDDSPITYYLIIPSTFAANQDGQFLLRLHCDVPLFVKYSKVELENMVKSVNTKQCPTILTITSSSGNTFNSDQLFCRQIRLIGGKCTHRPSAS